MWLSKYFVYFVIFSVMGWIYESIFCSIKARKWENRGFLYGPVVPIYGAGGVGLMIVIDLLAAKDVTMTGWQLFLVGCVGSFVLEYGTSWTLEKLFHARWWDYHYMPLNINGRVCLPYTICFGMAALLVNYAILPFTLNITSWITPILFEFFGLIFIALMAADGTLTVTALTDFNKRFAAMEEAFNKKMEGVFDTAFDGIDERRAAADEKKLQKALEQMEAEESGEKKKGPELRLPSREELAYRFGKDARDQYLNGLSALRKSALKRVQVYKDPKSEEHNQWAEDFFTEIKKRLPKRK